MAAHMHHPVMLRRAARFVYHRSRVARFGYRVYLTLLHWAVRQLSGLPTEQQKSRTVIRHGQSTPILIETGTWRGVTVAACLGHFERIYTIELDPALFETARDRFAGEPSVTVIHGDSYTELSRKVTGPVLFWLDAHYSSGDTAKGPHDPPLPWELRAILGRSEPDVILIDDARHMGVLPDYPSIEEIRHLVGERASSFKVRRDIIRISLNRAEP